MRYSLSLRLEKSSLNNGLRVMTVSLASFRLAGRAAFITSPKLQL